MMYFRKVEQLYRVLYLVSNRTVLQLSMYAQMSRLLLRDTGTWFNLITQLAERALRKHLL